MRAFNLLFHIFIFTIFFLNLAGANDSTAVEQIPVTNWLSAGPIELQVPVFSNAQEALKEYLDFNHIEISSLVPKNGAKIKWDNATTLKWEKIETKDNELILDQISSKSPPQLNYFAFYINVSRWVKFDLSITSPQLFNVYLNGESIAIRDKIKEGESESVTKEVKLETGTHLILIKSINEPSKNIPWKLKAAIKLDKKYSPSDIEITTSEKQKLNLSHILDSKEIRDAAISPDGNIVAVSFRQTISDDGKKENWIELRDAANGRLIQTYRGGAKISTLKWCPAGHKFSYVENNDEKSTMWIIDMVEGSSLSLLENIENFDSYTWSPSGDFIIYSIIKKADEIKDGLKKLRGMPDRWPEFRDRSFLYIVNYPEGTTRKLTAGSLSTDLSSISSDGEKLLFSTNKADFSERPYSKSVLYSLDINSMKIDSIWSGSWLNDAQWSPDGKKILLTGGPSLFGELGQNVPKGSIPNDYDTQAYIYNLSNKQVDPITKEFNPSISSAEWFKDNIYFRAENGSVVSIYRYNIKSKKYTLIDSGLDDIDELDIAKNRNVAVYYGSGVNKPSKVMSLNLDNLNHRTILEPAKEQFANVAIGNVEDWNFKNKQGYEIQGRVHFPSDFDASKKYPCIVYYYGGTSPVTRSFGGRYPMNYYAANGYIVYVLQPSGAYGYGQEFSALHVNDWGKTTTEDIIDGVSQFLTAHSYVDPKRVGCIGASYGGFMTMYLLTKTDMFATGISHAGISSLSSYWGEGFWGYLYSAVATANSFPWNQKDLYTDQGALFNADKINTPLLLLHGAEDTNVPPGESRQLYTALKLLGKEVELIEIEGQNHWILDYKKRIKWTKTIVAWFDKWLKDQPVWWDDLYSKE